MILRGRVWGAVLLLGSIAACSDTPELADNCPAGGTYTINKLPKECANGATVDIGGMASTPVTAAGTFRFDFPISMGMYGLTLVCGSTHFPLATVQVPCTPGRDLTVNMDDLSMAPDLLPPGPVRGVMTVYIDETTPGPTPMQLQAMFFAATQTPTAEAAIAMAATDPFDAIADDTCGPIPTLGAISGLPPTVNAGDSIKLFAGGAAFLTANASTGASTYYNAGNVATFSPTFINPGIDVFVIDHLNVADTKLGTFTGADLPDVLKQPFTASRAASKTFTWDGTLFGIEPRIGFEIPLANRACVTSAAKGSITIPASELSGLPAGQQTFHFWLRQGFSLSMNGLSSTPPAGARTAYAPETNMLTFRFLTFTVGGVLN